MNNESPVVALPIRFDVEVTQTEIDTAIPLNSGHCMIADAVKRCYERKTKRRALSVAVDLQTIRLTDPEKAVRYIYLTPTVAQRALLQFDQGITPTPHRFRLKANGAQAIPVVRKRTPKPRTAAQEKSIERARRKSLAARKQRAGIHTTTQGDTARTHVKVGGKAPPRAVLSGNIRQFGIRAAGMLDAPTQ